MPSFAVPLRATLTSLKFRLTTSVILVLALGMSVVAVLVVRRAEGDILQSQRRQQTSQTVRTAAVLSRRVIDLQRALLASAGRMDRATLADPHRLQQFLESNAVLRGMFSSVFVIAADGRMLMLSRDQELTRPGTSLADREYFRRTMQEGRTIVSQPITSRISGEPMIAFTSPLRDAGGIYGVLAGSLGLASRDLVADLVQDDETGSLLIVADAQGRILAHPQEAQLLTSLTAQPRLAQAYQAWVASGAPIEPSGMSPPGRPKGEDRSAQHEGTPVTPPGRPEGEDRSAQQEGAAATPPQPDEVVSLSGVAGTDWVVWHAVAESDLLAPLRAARKQALFLVVLLLSGLSLLMLMLLARLLRPLAQLGQRAQHLFDGSHDPHEGWPAAGGEIGRLAQVLRHVGAERAQLEFFNNEVLQKLGSVMAAAPIGIAFTREQRFELVSAELCRILGAREDELLGQPVEKLYAEPADYLATLQEIEPGFAEGRPYVGEWRMLRADGSTFWAQLRGRPVDRLAPDAGSIWTLHDVSEQVASREQLEWSATHDGLTGLANRTAFQQRLDAVFAARPSRMPASLVVIDLDDFKPINDTGGHAAGDAMLRAVATAIVSRVRTRDLVVRTGGDEFALLLEACPPATALRLADHVHRAIIDIALPWRGGILRVGASLGVAALTAETASVESWLDEADAACYEVKRAGRGAMPPAARRRRLGAAAPTVPAPLYAESRYGVE